MNMHLHTLPSRYSASYKVKIAAVSLLLGCGLLAQAQVAEYEGFDYIGTTIADQNGGTGWNSPWANTNGNAALTGDGLSLAFPGSVAHTAAGSRLVFTTAGVVERSLGTPMPLNVEGSTFYFSALVNYQGAFKFEFWDATVNARWRIGATNNGNSALIHVVAPEVVVPNVFPPNEPVLVVAKMITRATAGDQVFINVYKASDIVPSLEPTVWQGSAASASGVTLTRLRIQNLMDLPLEVDEIRVGTTWSSVAGPVAAGAPVVTRQPLSTSVYEGSTVQLAVEATGALPMSFQWRLGNNPISGATNSVLSLTNLQASQAGDYRVNISNSAGNTDSSPATVNLILYTNINVGLQAFWHFDESSGLTAFDATANNNHGVLTNFTGNDSQWIASDFTRALAFNSAMSNAVEVAHSASIGSQLVNRFSVAAWIRSSVPLSGNGNLYRAMEKENSFFLLQGDGNTNNIGNGGMNLLIKKAGANIPASIYTALEANRWYHIAGTFDGSNIRMYLDGELRDTRAVAAPIDSTTLPLRIGSDYMPAITGTKYFNGAMDEVGIWDRPLQQAEILELAGQAGPPIILEQPESRSAYVGGSVTFRVRARGQGPLKYMWFKGATEIRNATSNVLTVANIQLEDAGDYRCRISNDIDEIFSQTATLTVIPVTSITDGAEAIWKLDESTGLVAADASGKGRAGQLVDHADTGSQWIAGRVNNALSFTDGLSNRVVATDSASLHMGNDATFAFWIRPASYGTVQNAGTYLLSTSRVLRKGGHFDIEVVDDPGSVRASIRANGIPAPQQNILQLNEWQHFAVVFSGGMVKFYKNGFLLGEPVPGNLGGTNTNLVVLGNFTDTLTSTNFFNGAMDEVGIWNRTLSEVEILSLAARDVAGAPVIVAHPQSATRYVGSTISFAVDVTGLRPVTYEWSHNGTPIPDSNTNRLALTNLTMAHAGTYTVRAQNSINSDVSLPAVLTVQDVADITTGLVAYWPFDETAGTTFNDASGNGHHAALQGGNVISSSIGIVGGSYDFNGSSAFAITPHAPDLNLAGQVTISVWLNPRTMIFPGDRGRIIRKDINFDFTLLTTGSRFMMYGQNKAEYLAPPNTATSNEWQHFAVVVKDGTVQFFKNGRALSEPFPGSMGPAVTNDLIIGNFGPDLSINRLFNGYMDELGIWDRALSASELDGIYQNGLTGKGLNMPFDPFKIHTIDFPAAGQVRLVYHTPYTGQEHVVQQKEQMDGAWVTRSSVTFSDLGNGLTEAVFAQAENSSFYRLAALPLADVFFQDFEGEVAGWTHGGSHDTWELGVPANGPGAAHSGTKVYGTGLNGNVIGGTDSYLRSPAISLAGLSRATLSFREWRSIDPDTSFHWTYVNVREAGSMTLIQQLTPKIGGTSAGYELITVPLPPQLLGRSVVFEWVLSTDSVPAEGVPGVFVDDVRVSRE